MLVQYSALALKEREDRFARRQKKLNEKHRAYISAKNVGKKKEWREISRKLPLKWREKKEVAKNLIPHASVSKRPCQPIFPVKRVPSRSIPLLPPPISFQPFRTKFIQRETILEKDLNSISLSLSFSFFRGFVYIITNYLRIKNADSTKFFRESGQF